MQNWSPVFLAVALLAGLLAFSGIERGVATVLLVIFLGLFVASLIFRHKGA